MDAPEDRIRATGVPDVSAAITFQIPNFFLDRDFAGIQRSVPNLQHLRLYKALMEGARRAGATVALEQVVATQVSEVVFHRVAVRIHILTKPIVRWAIEAFIKDVCAGEMRKPEDNPNRRRRTDTTIPDTSWRQLTEADIVSVSSLVQVGDADQILYQPWTDAESAPATAGIFGMFMSTAMLPVYEEGEGVVNDAISNRNRTLRIEIDPTTGHDPTRWDSYFAEVSEEPPTFAWKPNSDWEKRHIRYVNFGSSDDTRHPLCTWLTDADQLDDFGLPWEEPSLPEIRTWLEDMVTAANMYVPNVASMPEEQAREFVRTRNPLALGRPIMLDTVAAAPMNAIDATLYPPFDKLHRRITSFESKVKMAVTAGRLGGSEIAHANRWSLGVLKELFVNEQARGFPPMHATMYRAMLRMVLAFNRDTMLSQCVGSEQRLLAKCIRLAAWNPRGPNVQVHAESVDVYHFMSVLENYGFTPDQRHAIGFMTAVLGSSMLADYEKHGINLGVMTGPPGSGKSTVLAFIRQMMPPELEVLTDNMSNKALLYAGDSLDMKVMLRDEMAGQSKSTEGQLDLLIPALSGGRLFQQTAVFSPQEDGKGNVVSAGTMVSQGAPFRTTINTCANVSTGAHGGALDDRAITFEINKGQARAPETVRGMTVRGAACRVSQIITVGVAVHLSFSSYGAAGIPNHPCDAMFHVFKAFVIDRVPELTTLYSNNRSLLCLKETVRNLSLRRWMAAWMFKGRSTAAAAAAVAAGEDAEVRTPNTPEYARYARMAAVTAIDCVTGLGHMPPGQSASYNNFMAVLTTGMAFQAGGSLIEAEHPDDVGYYKTRFFFGKELKLPNTLVERCTAADIPPIFLDSIRRVVTTKPLFDGAPSVKAETVTTGGTRPAILIHGNALHTGYRHPTPGQRDMLSKIATGSVFFSYADQKYAYLDPEYFKGVLANQSTYNPHNELSLMEKWRDPDHQTEPCMWAYDRTASPAARVRGRLSVSVAELLAADAFGATTAAAGGPLDVDGEGDVFIRPKMLVGGLGMHASFFSRIGEIALGRDPTANRGMHERIAVINQFLLAAGVKPGCDVWLGHRPPSDVKNGSTAILHRMSAETFVVRVKNPIYEPRRDQYSDIDADAAGDGLGAVFSQDDQFIEMSERSRFDSRIQQRLRADEDALFSTTVAHAEPMTPHVAVRAPATMFERRNEMAEGPYRADGPGTAAAESASEDEESQLSSGGKRAHRGGGRAAQKRRRLDRSNAGDDSASDDDNQ